MDYRQNVLFAVAFLAAITIIFIYQRYSKLKHIPGPAFATLTDYYFWNRMRNGESPQAILKDLHQQYGPTVRVGPNRVSFANPDSVPVILGVRNAMQKGPSYRPISMVVKGKPVDALMTVMDESRVTSIKRSISGYFSQDAWLKKEDQINDIMSIFIQRLRDQNGKPIQLMDWFGYWTMDTMTRLAFSEDFGYLTAGRDLHNSAEASKQLVKHWTSWMLFPKLETFLFKNPVAQRMVNMETPIAAMALKCLQKRMVGGKVEAGNDLLGLFLGAHLADNQLFEMSDVLSMTISTLLGGLDTTAMGCAMTLIGALNTGDTFEKLKKEICDANLPVPPPFEKVAGLPYLDACLREALRINQPTANSFERQTSASGREIAGVWVPPKTNVAAAVQEISLNKAVFGADAEVFRPERWLEADEERFRLMEKYSLGFGFGKRICVGQHLAKIEIKKAISSLLTEFEIVPCEKPRIWYSTEGYTWEFDLKVKMLPRST